MIPINPVGIGMQAWADQMVPLLETFGVRSRLLDESDWPRWALYVYINVQRSKPQVPDPRFFPDWRTWAQRLIAVLMG